MAVCCRAAPQILAILSAMASKWFAVLVLVGALNAPAAAQVFDWAGKIELDAAGLESTDPKTRHDAVAKLGRYAIEWTKPYLLDALEDKDIEVRSAAGRLLGKGKVEEALPVVVKWLTEADSRTKQTAAEILGQLGSRAAVSALVRSLGDSDHEVRLRAVVALGDIGGPEVVVPMIGRLEDDKPAVRLAAVQKLMSLADRRAVIPLVGIFDDSSLDVRVEAVKAVGRLGDRAAVPALVRLLADPAENVKIEAVTALGNLAASDATERLIAQLESGSQGLKTQAAYALGQIAKSPETDPKTSRWAMRALVEQLSDGTLKAASHEALLHAGSAAVPPLIEHLEGKIAGDPATAVMLLRDIGDARATPALITELDRGRISRELVLDALSHTGDQRALVPVLDLLSDNDPTVRLHAMRALRPMLARGSMAADVLVDMLGDRNLEIQVLAAEYLGIMGANVAVPALSNLAEASQKKRLRHAAVRALGEIGDPRANSVLVGILRDGPASLHMAAANALIYIHMESQDDSAKRALLDLAGAQTTVARVAVIRALGGVLREKPDGEARALLEKLARRDRLTVSLAAIAALSSMGDRASIGALVELVEQGNRDRRRAALEALGNLGDASVRPLLVSELASTDDAIAGTAAWALGKLGPGDAVQKLFSAIGKRKRFATPINASAALAMHATQKNADYLLKQLNHPNRFVRINIAEATGRLKLAAARPALLDLMARDPSWLVRVAAARALSRIGGARAELDKAGANDAEERARDAIKGLGDKPFAPRKRNQWMNFYFVDPSNSDSAVKQEPYFIVGSDGLALAIYSDARGEAAEERFPGGDYVIDSAPRDRDY